MKTHPAKPRSRSKSRPRRSRPSIFETITQLRLPDALEFDPLYLSPPTAAFPDAVARRLIELRARTTMSCCFLTVWNQVLTSRERSMFLVHDHVEALDRFRYALVLVMCIRRVWLCRAVLDVAVAVSLITEAEYNQLCREIAALDPVRKRRRPMAANRDEDSAHASEQIRNAVKTNLLVVVDTPAVKAVYWDRVRLAVDWGRYGKLWQFFVQLTEACQSRGVVAATDLDAQSRHALANWKYRLAQILPGDLSNRLQYRGESGGYHLRDVTSSCVFTDIGDLTVDDLL